MKNFLIIAAFVFILLSVRAEAQFVTGTSTATYSTVTCQVTSTLIEAANNNRYSFVIQAANTTNATTICLNAETCTAGTTLSLNNGFNPIYSTIPYEVIGPISCISVGGTTSVTLTVLVK